jgi:CDP-paratose 2-epimerase
MDVAIITGSAGLIGSEATEYYLRKNFQVIGIDNDLRGYFFGVEGSTAWNRDRLMAISDNYQHQDLDIRNFSKLEIIFKEYSSDIKLIVHAAAQPSHDWAAREPLTDFTVNANGTLNLLELTRRHCPAAVFIFTSSNKVYGDLPNRLPLIEQEARWEVATNHPFFNGIDETMSIDQSKHSLFGASKVAADVLVQEYGRYFDMKTVCFRSGCLSGSKQSGTMLHGFLGYLMKCAVTGQTYTVFGYLGKQVRDNIHSADLVEAFNVFYTLPKRGEVYNIGGGRKNNCSILEAMSFCERITGKKIKLEYVQAPRNGDHMWYISSLNKFKRHYPFWEQRYDLEHALREIYENNRERWTKEKEESA